jgi:hypothetical protein
VAAAAELIVLEELLGAQEVEIVEPVEQEKV